MGMIAQSVDSVINDALQKPAGSRRCARASRCSGGAGSGRAIGGLPRSYAWEQRGTDVLEPAAFRRTVLRLSPSDLRSRSSTGSRGNTTSRPRALRQMLRLRSRIKPDSR